MPDGFEFSPYPERPKERYSSFARGVVGGLVDDIYTRQSSQRQQETDARSNALKFLQTLPMSEQNAPIITRMALDILAAKPGKKHWTDQAFGTGKATNQFVDEIWGKLKGILPQDQAESPEAFREQVPAIDEAAKGEVTTTYRSPQFGEWANPPLEPTRLPGGITQPTFGPGGGQPEFTGMTMPSATRPREVMQYLGGRPDPNVRSRTVTEPYGEPSAMMAAAAPRRPMLDRNRISFANLPGKWKTMTGSYQGADGQDFLLQVDERTGQTRRIPLGAVSTERQLIAEQGAQQRADTAEQNRFKQVIARAAAFAGMDPLVFQQMPAEFKLPYFQQAGQLANQLDLGLGAQRTANTALAGDRGALARSQTKFYDLAAQQGGVTPNQQASIAQRNMDSARRFKIEFDELNAKAIAAKQALDLHMNPTGMQGQMQKEMGLTAYTTKQLELQRAYTQAIQAVQAKAREGASLFPGYLQGSGTELNFLPQPQGFQGGVNQGAIMTPSRPQFGALQGAMNPATGLPYSATGDLPPANATTVTPGQFGKIGGPGATAAPSSPAGPFPKGAPPPISMQLGPKGGQGQGAGSVIVPGTATNPATGFASGSTVNLGGRRYKVGTVTKPSKEAPFGTVQLTRIQ